MSRKTIAAVGAALILTAFVTTAEARTHRQTEVVPVFDRHAVSVGYDCGPAPVKVTRHVKARRAKHHRRERTVRKDTGATVVAKVEQTSAPLVEKARALIGRTASQLGLPAHLWCADFIAKIAPDAARKVDNPRWARDYAALPKTNPKVGAIVVLSRGRGGHIGVVSGFDSRGNPIIISGNHGHRVAEARYPKYRVLAYVKGDE